MSELKYRDRLRDEILTLACDLLESEGLDALQARRIAKEADCSVGTVYNIFGDIDGLIMAANSKTLAAMGQALQIALQAAGPQPLRESLMTLATAYAQFASKNQRPWEAVFKYHRPNGADVSASYLADQARLLILIEEAITISIPDAARRAKAARALFGAVHGIVALALDNRLGGQLRAELDEQVRFIVDTLARGLS